MCIRDSLAGGRINKIAQPETDELLLTCRGPKGNCRLLLSASASLPLIYFTQKNKPSPLTAPNFCMLDVYKRQVISISAQISKEEAIAAGKNAVADKLTGNIVKEIYVPKKIINIVMK